MAQRFRQAILRQAMGFPLNRWSGLVLIQKGLRILHFMSFEALQLAPPILKALAQCGHQKPTQVQAEAIPKALAGHDIIASAQTGTGKTAAFVLPALQRLSVDNPGHKSGLRVLVLTPTRELADQVTQATRTYGKYLRVKSVAIFGGMPFGEQIKGLSRRPDMIVATPGRLLDHMERGRIDLSQLEMLVMDEADRMLDMGFIDDVKRISSTVPKSCQILLFAATVGSEMTRLAQGLMKNPERIQIAPGEITHDRIEQRLHLADNLNHKNRMLQHLCADSTMTRAIIFSATRRDADSLAHALNAQGYSAAALHGDMTQNARNRTMLNMRRGKIRLLVATDVAARGLDVTGITHVINFDLPRFAEDYVHRIGRTGRAGKSGIAISFASRADLPYLNRIERYMGQNLPMSVIPGLEPAYPMQRQGSDRKNIRDGVHARGRESRGRNARSQNRPFSYKETDKTGGYSGLEKRGAIKRDRDVTVEYRSGRSALAGRTEDPKPKKRIFM
jgi:superfamily II DNA/RNA helicase